MKPVFLQSLLLAILVLVPSGASARDVVSTSKAPAAIGPYVQAVGAGGVFYLSGQLPLDPKTGAVVGSDIRAQTEQVLHNLEMVLAARGLTLDNAVQAQVYLVSMDDFAAMNEVYGRHFRTPPARATVQVSGLAKHALVEISLIAVQDNEGSPRQAK